MKVIMTTRENMEYEVIEDCKSLANFTRLAQKNWEKAVAVFYYSNFPMLLEREHKKYFALYRGLSVYEGNEHNVEEFLQQTNQKSKVRYAVNQKKFVIEHNKNYIQWFTIKKDGWGYVSLDLECDKKFVILNKTHIKNEDFLGDECRIGFQIDIDYLHNGKNFAEIIVRYETMEIKIQVEVAHKNSYSKISSNEERKLIYEILNLYEKMKMKHITGKEWVEESFELVEALEKKPQMWIISQLFRTHLFMTQKNYEYAKRILNQLQYDIKEQNNIENYCYFLYLISLYNQDPNYGYELVNQMNKIYHQNEDNWKIAWFYIFVTPSIYNNPSKKWEVLKNQFMNGCYSPIMMMEVIQLWNQHPEFLTQLDQWQCQILYSGLKKNIVSQEVIEKIAYLARRRKCYGMSLLKVLQKSYECAPSLALLESICLFLINLSKEITALDKNTPDLSMEEKRKLQYDQRKSFYWFQLGIEKNLRMAGLYECFMQTMDKSIKHDIPKNVIFYFTYQNKLGYEEISYLYAYIIQNQHLYHQVLEGMKERITQFIIEQIIQGRINPQLSYLYQKVELPEDTSVVIKNQLIDLLFTQIMKPTNAGFRYVIVVHRKIEGEKKYQIRDEKAFPVIVGNDNLIFVEDDKGNRYSKIFTYEEVQIERLKEKAQSLAVDYSAHLALCMLACNSGKEHFEIEEGQITYFECLLSQKDVVQWFYSRVYRNVLDYYEQHYLSKKLKEALSKVQPEQITPEEISYMIKIFLRYELYWKAYVLLCQEVSRGQEFHFEKVDVMTVFSVVTAILSIDEMKDDYEFTCIVSWVFEEGYYNESVLDYLLKYYNSDLENMRKLWLAAKGFDLNPENLANRYFIQMVQENAFCLEEEEVFVAFANSTTDVNILSRYMKEKVYAYIRDEKDIKEVIVQQIPKVKNSNTCKIAYLKYYAKQKDLKLYSVQKRIVKYLSELIQKENIYLPFFREFQELYSGLATYSDQTSIVYIGKGGSKVTLYYRILSEEGEREPYLSEEMNMVVAEIYVKSMVICADESIEYYVTETMDMEEYMSKPKILFMNKLLLKESKFTSLQGIIEMKMESKYEEAEISLEKFVRQQYLVDKIFTLQ